MGRVRSKDRVIRHNYGGTAVKKGRILAHSLNGQGYPKYHLKEGDKDITKAEHLLVWEAFNGPVPEGMQVNHINEIKTDNRLENLNLMTPKENTNWGTCIARRSKKAAETRSGTELYNDNPNSKMVMEYDKDGKEVMLWFSINAAAEHHKKDYTTLWLNITGKTKTMKDGTFFRYYKEAF